MVDWRVGHLREALLEIAVEQSRRLRQHREGGVIPHREDRLFALGGHRSQHVGELFFRIAEGGLTGDQVGHDRLVRLAGVE